MPTDAPTRSHSIASAHDAINALLDKVYAMSLLPALHAGGSRRADKVRLARNILSATAAVHAAARSAAATGSDDVARQFTMSLTERRAVADCAATSWHELALRVAAKMVGHVRDILDFGPGGSVVGARASADENAQVQRIVDRLPVLCALLREYTPALVEGLRADVAREYEHARMTPSAPAAGKGGRKQDDRATPDYVVDAKAQTITHKGRVHRFGNITTWAAFVKLWNARPNWVDLTTVENLRETRHVAADVKRMLVGKGLTALANGVKNQRGFGYFLDLPQ